MRFKPVAFGAIAACVLLGACSSAEDIFVAPGKYAIYNCKVIEAQGRTSSARERELKGLMDKASQGSGGAVVNALAYRNEYIATQGELKQLEQAAVEKKCDIPWRSVSDRSMF